jgi:hypothetical protein
MWAVGCGGDAEREMMCCWLRGWEKPSGARNLEARRRGWCRYRDPESRLWLSRAGEGATLRKRRQWVCNSLATGNDDEGTASGERRAGAESRELAACFYDCRGSILRGCRCRLQGGKQIKTPANHGERLVCSPTLFPPTVQSSFHLLDTAIAGTRHLCNSFVNTISIQSSWEGSSHFNAARCCRDRNLSGRYLTD